MRWMLALVAVVLAAAAARGQESYPSRQITVIVPFAAGGSTDLVARIISDGLRRKLGQPVVVDNRPGGAGVQGTRDVVAAKPDGYTLLLGNVGIPVIAAAMNANFPFDPARELTAISMAAEFVIVMMVRKDLPVGSLAEFVAYARAHPGELNFGSSGTGTLAHLAAELLMQRTGIRMQHVPYKGGANSLTDLMSGALDVLFAGSSVAAGQVASRAVKTLAVSSTYRLKLLPDVPTMQEGGVPDFDVTGWFGLMGPAGLPLPIRQTLSDALIDIVRDPAAQEKLRHIGFEPVGTGWRTFESFLVAEQKRWSEFVTARGLRTPQ